MHPHPNRLPRWLRTLLLASGSALLLTGLLWAALHWRAGIDSAALLLPHAWEHPLMQLHGLAVITFLFACGALTPVHLPRGWRERRNWRSGLALATSVLALAASGYALYYWVGEASRIWVGLGHTVLGLMLAAAFAGHWRGRYSAPSSR